MSFHRRRLKSYKVDIEIFPDTTGKRVSSATTINLKGPSRIDISPRDKTTTLYLNTSTDTSHGATLWCCVANKTVSQSTDAYSLFGLEVIK